MKFHKYHGLGNDYIVIDPEECDRELDIHTIKTLCHRNFGIGSDGILFGPETVENTFKLKIYNPDGSEAEKSGNGLRIFSRYLWDSGKVKDDPFIIRTAGGDVTAQVLENGAVVRVAMGKVSFNAEAIPVHGEIGDVLNCKMVIRGKNLTYCAATVGNPHCVVTSEPVTPETARKLGPLIEVEKRFPNRTNVQFLEVLDRNNIRIEIWERGAGYTLASGSSSSAAAAVARKLGFCDKEITVHMPGGKLKLSFDDDFSVTMTGPVAAVCDGVLRKECLN